MRSDPELPAELPPAAAPTAPMDQAPPHPSQPRLPHRLQSLDAFRGLAIAAMILVNNPGSWDYVYPPLEHAKWHGCTPTDLVFPFFMFAIGTAMAFSLGRNAETGQAPAAVYQRILRRVVILFALGLALNFSSLLLGWLLQGKAIALDKLRLVGVLQRIALAYGLAAPLVLNLSRRSQAIAAAGLLFGYWALLAGNLTPEGNLAGQLDRLVFTPARLYLGGPSDPEGLLATLPAVVSILVGYWVGQWLKTKPLLARPPKHPSQTSGQLAAVGLGVLVLGQLWSLGFPLNKSLWSSSFVLYSSGWAMLVLAALWEAIEVRRWRAIGLPLVVMGLNAITVFVASGLVARVFYRLMIGGKSLQAWIFEWGFASWAGNWSGSLLMAIVTLALWWLAMYGLYRQGWFWKI